jgi:hypothetical protein
MSLSLLTCLLDVSLCAPKRETEDVRDPTRKRSLWSRGGNVGCADEYLGPYRASYNYCAVGSRGCLYGLQVLVEESCGTAEAITAPRVQVAVSTLPVLIDILAPSEQFSILTSHE